MARIYLCARYGRRAEVQEYAHQLTALGHQLTSRWVTEPPRVSDDGRQGLAPAIAREIALADAADVHMADTVIAFAEETDAAHGRGGRHVEVGIALEIGCNLLVVGPVENVYYALATQRFDTFEACLDWLTEEAPVERVWPGWLEEPLCPQ